MMSLFEVIKENITDDVAQCPHSLLAHILMGRVKESQKQRHSIYAVKRETKQF